MRKDTPQRRQVRQSPLRPGADERSSPGKLELCDSGTILLDEIVHMPIGLQEKLLHVIQTKQFVKRGTGIPHDVDVRVLAATDVNIEKALSEQERSQLDLQL